MPNENPDTGRLETSIHRTKGLAERKIWNLGYRYVEQRPQRVIKARGLGVISLILETKTLSLDVTDEPFPFHADIIGWPIGIEAKSERMQLATDIANELKLQLDPRGN
jgi:hypothetical protein